MRKTISWTAIAALSVLLSACASEGRWTKEGVPPEQITADYTQCSTQAQHDIARDVNIDSDIEAGRDRDWQHDQSAHTHRASDATNNAKLSDNILDACMEARGYAPNGPAPSAGANWWSFIDM